VRCGGGDQEVSEWALQWLVAGNRTHVYQLQAASKLVARCVAFVSGLVTAAARQ